MAMNPVAMRSELTFQHGQCCFIPLTAHKFINSLSTFITLSNSGREKSKNIEEDKYFLMKKTRSQLEIRRELGKQRRKIIKEDKTKKRGRSELKAKKIKHILGEEIQVRGKL